MRMIAALPGTALQAVSADPAPAWRGRTIAILADANLLRYDPTRLNYPGSAARRGEI